MAVFVDLAYQNGVYNSAGPTVTLDGAAEPGYLTFAAAGLVDAVDCVVTIEDGDNNKLLWNATYSSVGPTLTPTSVIVSIGTIGDGVSVKVFIGIDSSKLYEKGSFLALSNGYSEQRKEVVSAGAAQTIDLDGRTYDLTLTAASCALTINVPSGVEVGFATLLLRQDATGGRLFTVLGSPVVMGVQSDNGVGLSISRWIVDTPDGGSTILLTPAGTEI